MTVSVEALSTEMLDEAWTLVDHEVDAYHGYPDIQQDIIVTKAKEMLSQPSDTFIRQCGNLALVKPVKIG